MQSEVPLLISLRGMAARRDVAVAVDFAFNSARQWDGGIHGEEEANA
jgi:hypothetical protein